MSATDKHGAAERIRGATALALYCSGITGLSRRVLSHNAKLALNFHGISREHYRGVPDDAQPTLTIDDMRHVLRWLKQRFVFITPEEFLEAEKVGILLTFDDGLANNATNVIPLLEQFHAPALFFVSTQHVLAPRDWLDNVRRRVDSWCSEAESLPPSLAADLYDGMSRDQLAEASRHPLVTIGSHTVTHPLLTRGSDEQLRHELMESRRMLEEITGEQVNLFAYPSGQYDRRVLEAVEAAGYRAAFAVDSRRVGRPRFEIPRIEIYSSRHAYLAAKMSGLHRRPLAVPPLRQTCEQEFDATGEGPAVAKGD